MKRYLLLSALLFLFCSFSIAQVGDSRANPVTVGIFAQPFNYSDTKNTTSYTNQYTGRTTHDVFYMFTITRTMLVTLTHEGSNVNDTYMHLLNSSGTLIATNDDYSGAGHCSSIYNSYIQELLPEGTYYVVSEGYSVDGNIKTNISAVIGSITGDNMSNPISIGSKSSNFTYSTTVNTTSFTNQYQGRTTNDVYLKFILTVPMNVTITHEGSSLSDTYLTLLGSTGNQIASNNDYSGEGHCSNTANSFIQRHLEAGTYYAVSEGYSSNGTVKINITGNTSTGFNYSSIPSTYSSQSGPVGAMGGSIGVSPLGGATYSIPIEVPLGVGGAAPNMSIAYNSQAGNGLCGYGFNLTGLSSIQRGAKDAYHDNTAQGMKYLADDALYLDGTRLILSSGTAGQDGAIYNPESDPFTKVIAHGTCNSSSNNTWYEVQSSDGMVYWYTTQLSYTNGSSQRIHSWYLTRAIQPTGNFIEYTYDQSEYYVYPVLIAYGTNINQSNALSNTILFSYETRNDVIPVSFDGKKGSFNKRLKTITCKTNDQVFRTYTLNYNTTGDGTGNKYSRLTSVSERNGQNEALPATEFTWSYLPSASHTAISTTVFNPANLAPGVTYNIHDQTYMAGDMNGDGLPDIVAVGPVGDETVVEYFYADEFMGELSYYTTQQPNNYDITLNSGVFMNVGVTYNKDNSIVDMDGDGVNELVLCHYDGVENDYGRVILDVYGQNITNARTIIYMDRPYAPLITTGDIYNEGKNKVIILETSKNVNGKYRFRVLKLNENYGAPNEERLKVIKNLQLSLDSEPKQIFITDMNGNGISDLLVLCKQGFKVFWNQGEGTSVFMDSYSTTGSTFNDEKMRTAGDFNGDGLLDILTNSTMSSVWKFHLNNGNGTFTTTQACTLDAYDQDFTKYDDDKFHCRVLDFDGDGKDDVIIVKAKYDRMQKKILGIPVEEPWGKFNSTHTYWMRSVGNGLVQQYHATSNKERDAYPRKFLTADFDADGYVDLMNLGYDCLNGINENDYHIYRNNALTAQSGKLTSVKGDYGSTTSITYSTLTDNSVYTRGEIGSYPVLSYNIPLNVVKSVVQNNGAAGSMTTNYTYSGLKVHLHGRGLLGFNSTQANNTTMGTTVKTEITGWNNTYYVPSTTKTTTTVGGKTSHIQNTLTFVNKGGKKYFAYPSQTVKTDLDGNNVTTTRTFNTTYGYLTNENVSYGTNMYKSVSYSDYILAGMAYRPQTVTKSQCHSDDSSPYSNTTKYTYNTGTGLITKEIVNYGTSKPLTTQYTYDVWGNKTSQMSSGSGVTNLTTYYSYDGTHRFPERIYTNPSSSVQKYYYNIWGNVLTEQDSINSNNNITTHTYDNWGNRVSTQVPGSGMVTYTRGWGSDNINRFYVLEQGTSRPWVKTWYDNRGRVVKTESIGPKNVTISTTTTYNNKGLKSGETEITGNLTLSHSYSYDARGRLTSETHPGNNTISYSYGSNGRTKTVNNNGRSTTYTYDVMGNLKTVQSPLSSTLTHTYSSNGNIKQTVANGVTWVMSYDDCGNQISLNDPDAGNSQFTYDALGREIWRKDGRGITYSTYYDALGRVTYDGTTTFTYGTSGNGQMRLVSETNGRWTKSYVYDTYGRVTQETMAKNGDSYSSRSMSYQYNPDGLLTRKDYPNYKSTAYSYDSYGNCTSINANEGLIVWNLTGYNGQTTTTSISIDNSTPYVRTTNLDNNGYMQSRVMTLGSTTVQNDSYVFNARTGNLTSRTLTGHATETFSYDELDRLISQQSSEIDLDMYYETNGNFNEKTNLGEYYYPTGNAHAHAVDNIYVSSYGNYVPDFDQYIEYDYRNKPDCLGITVDDNYYWYTMEYGPNHQRVKSRLETNGVLSYEKFHWDEYEEYNIDGATIWTYWIEAPDGLVGMYGNSSNEYYTVMHPYVAMTDHLGSLTGLMEYDGTVTFDAFYDAWGKRTIGTYNMPPIVNRGFTGHENIDEIGLINMNGRMYDPLQALFLSPDPYIQNPSDPQNYNRYTYCLNNPLKYTDPTGEIFWIPIAIGAAIGGYTGYKIADAKGYDLGDAETWGYMLGGALIGGISGGVGAEIAATGCLACNSLSLIVSSSVYTGGMSALSGGMIAPSTNFGFGSYNFKTGEFNYLLDGDNEWYEDLGYGLGAIANISDILKGLNGDAIQLQTEKVPEDKYGNPGTDAIGHSQLLDLDGNSLVDFGPTGDFYGFDKGMNNWIEYASHGRIRQTIEVHNNIFKEPQIIKGVNLKMLQRYSNRLNNNPGFYNFALRSCSTQAARGLTLSGVPVLGTHPYLLRFQIENGLRPYMFNYTYTNGY